MESIGSDNWCVIKFEGGEAPPSLFRLLALNSEQYFGVDTGTGVRGFEESVQELRNRKLRITFRIFIHNGRSDVESCIEEDRNMLGAR